MKKIASILLICLCNFGFAQKGKIAVIDSDFILSKMPEYEEANKELKKRDAEWQQIIESKRKEIKDLKDQLNVERPLLTQQIIEEKEEDIAIIEKELLNFQNEKYNSKDGSYFKQKLDLAKPLQDQITTIVNEIAEKKRYTMVVDKAVSSETALMYVNKSDEISDQIIRKLELGRNKSKLSKKEVEQIEIAERQAEIKDRQRSKRDELEERQRILEEAKEQALAENNANTNTNVPTESPEEKRKREQLEKIEKAKADRERIRQEKLAEIEKRKADIAKKQEEARIAREQAKGNALEKIASNNSSKQPQKQQLSERAQQLKAQQEQKRQEALRKKEQIVAERKKLIEERKQKLEQEKLKRLKEIEDRKKQLENKK